jgi:hypothetical protein
MYAMDLGSGQDELVMTTLKLCVSLLLQWTYYFVYIGMCGSYPRMHEGLLKCVGDYFLECMR